jgi:hypothetical protein
MSKDTCHYPLAAQNLVLQDSEGCRRSQHQNNDDWKQVTQPINKIVHQTVSKDSTHHDDRGNIRIA